jgi:hypothetical protein
MRWGDCAAVENVDEMKITNCTVPWKRYLRRGHSGRAKCQPFVGSLPVDAACLFHGWAPYYIVSYFCFEQRFHSQEDVVKCPSARYY